MIAKSQEFNDNTGNPETELCFHCITYKTIDEFNTPEGSSVCQICYNKYLESCKELEVDFIKEERNQGHYSPYYRGIIDHIDVYAIKNNNKWFIRGYADDKKGRNSDLADIFNLKMKFLASGLQYIKSYGDLDILKNENFRFSCQRDNNFYKIHGNCKRISNAFQFKSINIKHILDIINYQFKISEEQKTLIIERLNSKDHYTFECEDYEELYFKDFRGFTKENPTHNKIKLE